MPEALVVEIIGDDNPKRGEPIVLTTNYALLTTHKDRLLVERFDKRHFCYMV